MKNADEGKIQKGIERIVHLEGDHPVHNLTKRGRGRVKRVIHMDNHQITSLVEAGQLEMIRPGTPKTKIFCSKLKSVK